MRGAIRTGVLMVLGAILCAVPAAGQGVGNMLPDVRTLPAPAWVAEGVRLSYYSRAMTIPGVYGSYVRDDEGNWVGQTSGKRYRWEDMPARGGHGVTQVDVLSLDARAVMLNVHAYQYFNVNGPLVPVGQSWETGLPSAGGDYWIHPKALLAIPQRLAPGQKILRMPFKLGNQTIQTLRIQRETERTRHVYMFDLETGRLVHMNAAAQDPAGKSTLCTEMTLLGTRQLTLPWVGAALPPWLGQGAALRYQGTCTQVVMVPRPHPFPFPMTVDIRVTARGERTAVYDQTATTTLGAGAPPHVETKTLATGVQQIGGLCLPPQGLRGLRAGQVIDVDPVTKVTTRVQSAAGGHVVISAANAGCNSEAAYDTTSGALTRIKVIQGGGDLHRQVTELSLTRRAPGG